MIISCPNLSDKKIAAEFNELLQALDGDENAAYQIWSMNNGNSIDMAPNGEPSILFADLLTKYNGDRISAIKDKAISFADNFIKTSEDANGEVLLKDLYSGISEEDISFKIYSNSIKLSNERKENVGKFIFGKLYPLRKIFSLKMMSPRNKQRFLNDYKYYADIDDILNQEIVKELEDIFLVTNIPYMEKGESLSLYIDRVIPYISENLKDRIDFYSDYLSKDYNKDVDYSSYFTLSRIFKNRTIDFSKLEERDKNLLLWKYPKMFDGKFKSNNQAFSFYKRKWVQKDAAEMKQKLDEESFKYPRYKKALDAIQARYDFINMPTAKNWIRSKIQNDALVKHKSIISNDELNLLRQQKLVLAEIQGRANTEKYQKGLQNLPDNYNWLFDKGFDNEYKLSYLLKNIIDRSGNERYKLLAEELYNYFVKNDVSVTFTKIPTKNLNDIDGHSVTNIEHLEDGDAIISDIYIELDPDALTVTKEPERILLHEAIHSTSSFVIAAGLSNEISQIIDHILNYLNVYGLGRAVVQTSINGLSSPQEFIADFYTAPEFQQMLKDIPPIPDTKFKNIFEHCVEIFKRAFFKLLGISPSSLYEQLSPIMDDIISLQQDLDQMNPIIEQLKKYDKYGEFEADVAFDILPEKHGNIKNILTLQLDQKSYTQSNVNQLLSSNPNATNEEVVDTMIASEKEWANEQQERIIGETQKQLIDAFGLVETENGYEIPGDNSEIAKLRIQFVNSMSTRGHIDTFRKAALDHYIISIGLQRGDATTFNHELAHYYIRTFSNSKLVQSALDLYAKKGMSIDEIEEALVDAITERSVDNEFGVKLEDQSFFQKFWYGFNNILYKVFNIKSDTARKSIADQLTKAFLVNDTLDQTKNDTKYQLSYHRMYQSEYQARREKNTSKKYKTHFDNQFDVIAGNIINATRSRQKSYEQRMRSDKIGAFANEHQATRNAEMARKTQLAKDEIEEARQNNNVARESKIKSKLYLDFLTNAYQEAHQLRIIMLNARANGFRRTMYVKNEDGSVSYRNVENEGYISEQNPVEGMLSTAYTFDDLEYAKTDILGFFKPIIQSIKSIIESAEAEQLDPADVEAMKSIFEETGLSQILEDIESTYNDGLENKVKVLIDDIVNTRVDLDQDMKERLRINMYKWLRDQMDYGDVKAAEVWVGLGSRSKSPILRAVHDMLADMQDERDKQVYDKAVHLMDLKRKAEKYMGRKYKYFYNVQKLLVQLDKHGMPTGNWLSRFNDGQYYQDREEFRDNLLFGKNFRGKYNNSSIEQQLKNITLDDGSKLITDKNWRLEIDKNGVPVIPEHPKADEIYKNYLREYETWVSERTERPYTLKYYLDRIDTLSTQTLKAVNSVNAKISGITSTVMRNGKPRYELLTQSQLQMLQSYEQERRDLRNFYDADNQLKNQNSVEYKIAYDLMMWDRKIQDKLSYVIDQDQYEESKNNSKNPRSFERMFSRMVVNPKLWEIIKSNRTEDPRRKNDPLQKELNTLLYQRSQFISRYRGDRLAEIKWEELFDESTGRLKNLNFWKNLNYMDTRISQLQFELRQKYKTDSDQTNNQSLQFGDVMDSYLIPYEHLKKGGIDWNDPETERWYGHMVQRMNTVMKNEQDANKRAEILDEIQTLASYKFGYNETGPLSIFSTYIPKLEETEYDGQKIKDFIRIPNSLFTKLDRNSSSREYVNRNYDENSDELIQLKDIYKDVRYDVLTDPNNKPLKDLYDALKKQMEESWSMIPFMSKYDNRLSQIAGRTGQILGRNMFQRFGLQFGSNLLEWLRREFSVVETDTDFRANDDKELRPDGSNIENIPIRFIKRLPKAQYISLDVVGSTISFMDMALNYKIKAQHASELISILRRLESNSLSDNYKHAFDAKQSEVLEGMLQRQLYDKHSTADGKLGTESDEYIIEGQYPKGFDWIRKYLIGKPKDWIKRLGKVRIVFQSGMLALNAVSGIISFLDPLVSLTIDTITGKYVNAKDVAYAIGVMAVNLPLAFGSLGKIYTLNSSNRFVNGKPMAAMQRFQLAKGNMQTFRDTDQSQAMRFLTDGLTMKYFTIGDYTINTINMVATMNNYRYYKDSSGTARFYSKPQFIQKVMQDKNCSVKEARQEYANAQTMWNSYHVDKTGKFTTTDDEYGRAIDLKTETQLRKQIRSRSSIYNGIVPDIERTYLQTNIFWSFVTLLRNFLITGVWERFQTYRDFQVTTFDAEGNPKDWEATDEQRKEAKKHQNYYKGGYSFATTQVENAVTWAGLYGFRHMFPYLKYAYFLSKNQINKTGTFSKYDPNNQQYMKEHNLSQQDVYGMQKIAMECFAWMFLLSLSQFTQRTADDDPDDYVKQLANLITLRLAIERYTWYSPTTAMELIQSPTTALSDWKRKMKIFALGADLASIMAGDQENNLVKRGYYQGEDRWKYDLFNVMSHYGLNNWYKSMPEIYIGGVNVGGGGARALKNTTNFYKTLRPEVVKLFDDDAVNSSSDPFGNFSFSSDFGSSFSSNF